MKIENKQVQEIYERWNGVWHNTEQSMEVRLKAYSILQVIEALTLIYEKNEELHEEEIDDLFIAWGEKIKPLFPENKEKLREQIKKQIQHKE
ncbi:hypothetical protein CVD28_00295 [Bacillus sp. M6-12]|uniref:hypothetical protein n=1 Tax=Bacillus sp. M6-12 TaxID=2054166 RepID=UPI000C784AAB|nr:hypothetical protein [Bacillus sp. M6-12]PLS18875.1 hypothetical protein CVD28_00295 [Bacillus sp. M6-12]